MLNHTHAALDKVSAELKLLAHVFTIVMQAIMLVYFIFALILPKGYTVVNIIGIAVTAFYLVFYLVTHSKESRDMQKSKKIVGKIVKFIKLSLSAFTLATVMYSAIMATSALDGAVTPFTLITTPLMILVWIMQIAIEAVSMYADSRFNLLKTGLYMDFEPVINPLSKVEGAIHRFFKEEEKERFEVDEKLRRELDKRADAISEQKKEEKKEMWERRGEVLVERIKESGDKLKESGEVLAERIKEGVKDGADKLKESGEALADKLKKGGESFVDKVKTAITKTAQGESDDSNDPKPQPDDK